MKEYATTMLAGGLLVVLGIIYQLTITQGIIPLLFLNAGTIMIVLAVIKHNKFGAGVQQDERTRSIGAKAISYSWLLTFIIVNVLFWLDFSDSITLSSVQIYGIILFVMTISAGAFQVVLQRRGV